MFSLTKHIYTCLHPTAEMAWLIRDKGNCVGVVRRSWGIPSLGANAYAAWDAVPAIQMRYTDPLDVPEGAICYGLNGQYGQPRTKYAHAWVASTHLEGWSTDYGGAGTWELCPMSLPRWTGDTRVQWTRWTPFGLLPVGRTQRQRNAATPPLSGAAVRLSNLKYGLRNDDVKDLQNALNRHLGGADLPVTGYYGTLTDAAVRRDQALHVPPVDAPGESFVGARQAVHLGLRVV